MDVFRKGLKLFLVVTSLLLVSSLHAREISVPSISASVEPDSSPPVIHLAGETRLELPGKVENALDNGITLDFEYEVILKKRRPLIWNPSLFHWVLRRQLSFFALSSKYVVNTDRDNSARVFPNLRSALQYLNKLDDVRLALPEQSDKLEGEEYLQFQMRLDIESLPLPMRPLAYVSSSWRLHTDWKDIEINP